VSTSIKTFIKNEIVLCIAFVVALVSCFAVRPGREYIGYIDFRTLSILLMLMITMAGFQRLNVFRQVGEILVGKMDSVRGVVMVLIALCFFSSMFITNDVALLTFVPFSIITLSISNCKQLYIKVIVLETLAANLGSMLTPLGNPQNLYLYSLSDMKISEFLRLMGPYSLCSAVLLVISVFIFVKKTPAVLSDDSKGVFKRTDRDKMMLGMYGFTFLLALLVVGRIVPYYIGLVIELALILIFDRRILRKPDYSLLLTFIFLFIFIGNMKRIPAISGFLAELIKKSEVDVAIILSQVISNVPAAILCSGFTKDIPKIIVGTNLGGLGTLIASMASLISFKQYSYIEGADSKRYIVEFTIFNIFYLIVLRNLFLLLQ
jgi:Na+/H+ antiporter NhaD/arsenite permease-like protein